MRLSLHFISQVPLSKAADCFEQILQETYSDSEVYKSFRTPPLLRFIRPDDGLISQATGEGVFYVYDLASIDPDTMMRAWPGLNDACFVAGTLRTT